MAVAASDAGELTDAAQLCVAASQLTLAWFGSDQLEVEQKDDGSPVTQADRKVEDFLREELSRRAPNDTVIGEERTDTQGSSGRTWYVDPIDGTKAFTHGVPFYSTLLAMHDEHGPALGVISLPALGEVIYAGRGLGCFAAKVRGMDGAIDDGSETEDKTPQIDERTVVKCRVAGRPAADSGSAQPAEPTPPVICMSGLEYLPAAALKQLQNQHAILRTWGDAYGYTLLVRGRVDAMIDYGMSPWDTAPLAVIVPEAGGVITSWDGQPAMQHRSVIAATPAFHPQLTQILAGTA